MYHQSAIHCTLNNIPINATTLQRSRLPFGVLIHPFDINDSTPVSEGLIIRCEFCRAYINPYARIGDHSSWQCNLCNRLNELPSQFVYNHEEQRYYDLGTKLELTSETIEYVGGVEFMIRPPPPALYMFVFECSSVAINLGFIPILANVIADHIDQIPGDSRASIGFIAFDSNIHYFSFAGSQVVHHVCADINDDVQPCPREGIVVNIANQHEMLIDFLTTFLPNFPQNDGLKSRIYEKCAMGAAIKAAIRIVSPVGGRITVINAQMPNHGKADDGSSLNIRQKGPMITPDKNITPLLNPASDFYKNLALECCESQISIDLFNLACSYADLATLAPMTKYSAGTVFHYSNQNSELKSTLIRFSHDLRNYLLRSIGFEAVLRLRCTKGLKLDKFYGNFFVRSPNLILLPNANPDSSYAFQISIEDDLKPETRFVYFQASLLYTTPDGQRRVRVHTARYPTVTTLPELLYGANQMSVVAMLAKMAVDRSLEASISEAKEALTSACVDLLEIYSLVDSVRAASYSFSLPENLRLIPLYVLALLKHKAFKSSPSVTLDERTAAMERFKTLPIMALITYIYPDMYPIHNISNTIDEEFDPIQLTAAHLERDGAYLLDAYDTMIIYVCESISRQWCNDVLGLSSFNDICSLEPKIQSEQSRPGHLNGNLIDVAQVLESPSITLPELDNPLSIRLREFIGFLIDTRPQKPKFYILKDDSRHKSLFTQYLIDDRSESSYSYVEFLKYLESQIRK